MMHFMNKNLVAIITARGGSKGLPRKNVLNLLGKPLIAHTINAAKESEIFQKIVVSTDDEEIKDISLQYGANVIDRPRHLATDTASSLDVIEHTLTELHKNGDDFSHFILLQPTSPLRTSEHIKKAWDEYVHNNATSLVSVTKEDHSPYKLLVETKNGIEPLFGYDYLTMPRQKLPNTYRINGAIYIAKTIVFLKSLNLFQAPMISYIMSKETSFDIDDLSDFNQVEYILKNTDSKTVNSCQS